MTEEIAVATTSANTELAKIIQNISENRQTEVVTQGKPAKPRKPIGTGRRSRQARRDPHEPVNPRSAYTMFVKEKMEELGVHIKDTPELKMKGKDQIKVVAQQWRDLGAEEKEKYQQMFTKAFADYEQNLAAYKQTESYRIFQEKLKAMEADKAKNNPSTSAPTPVSSKNKKSRNKKKPGEDGDVGQQSQLQIKSETTPIVSQLHIQQTPQMQAQFTALPSIQSALVQQSNAQAQAQLLQGPIKIEALNQMFTQAVPVSQISHLLPQQLPPGTVTLLAVTPQAQTMLQPQQQLAPISQALPSFPELSYSTAAGQAGGQQTLLAYAPSYPQQSYAFNPVQILNADSFGGFSSQTLQQLCTTADDSKVNIVVTSASGLQQLQQQVNPFNSLLDIKPAPPTHHQQTLLPQQLLQQQQPQPIQPQPPQQQQQQQPVLKLEGITPTDIVTAVHKFLEGLDEKTAQNMIVLEDAFNQLKNKLLELLSVYQSQGQSQSFVSELQNQLDKLARSGLPNLRPEIVYKLQELIRSLVYQPTQSM